MNAAEPLYWGLKFYELLTLIGIIVGPIAAVAISLWIDGRRKDREQKLTILRMLIATRHLPADPAFFTAVNLVPIEFSKSTNVMTAYKEFIEAVAVKIDDTNTQEVSSKTEVKTVRLIYEVARSLGFPLRETDLQTNAYVSRGYGTRDGLLLDSQQAMRDIAMILAVQTRILADQALSEREAEFIDSRIPKQ